MMPKSDIKWMKNIITWFKGWHINNIARDDPVEKNSGTQLKKIKT